MGQPGAVDGIQLFVQPVEDHTTDHQAHHDEQEECQGEPSDHHCHMVQAEGCSTEYVRQSSTRVLFQIGKDKTTEEELLQERIREGDIEAHIEEIILCNACIICQSTGDL